MKLAKKKSLCTRYEEFYCKNEGYSLKMDNIESMGWFSKYFLDVKLCKKCAREIHKESLSKEKKENFK